MPKWNVTLPVAGSVTVYGIEANDVNAAIDLAMERQDWRVETGPDTECGEFDSFKELSRGNVLSAPVHRAYAEQEEE